MVKKFISMNQRASAVTKNMVFYLSMASFPGQSQVFRSSLQALPSEACESKCLRSDSGPCEIHSRLQVPRLVAHLDVLDVLDIEEEFDRGQDDEQQHQDARPLLFVEPHGELTQIPVCANRL